MAIVGLLSQGDFEADAQRADEIAMLVTIIYKGMHQAHLLRARVEIQTDGERQEALLLSLTRGAVGTFDLHDSAHITRAFHSHLGYCAHEIAEGYRTYAFQVRSILRGTNQQTMACQPPSVKDQAVEDCVAALGDIGFQTSRTDADLPVGLADRQGSRHAVLFPLVFLFHITFLFSFLLFSLKHNPFRTSRHHGCKAAPLHTAVRPVSSRPEVGRQDFTLVRGQRKAVGRLQLAFRERDAEADGFISLRYLSYPMQAGRHIGRNCGCCCSCNRAEEESKQDAQMSSHRCHF